MSTNPYLQGYGAVFNKNAGELLGQIPGFQNTVETRMAAVGLEQDAKNQILENQLKMMELGVQSQQPQKKQGFGLEQGLGLAANIFGAASGAGAFGGGGSTGTDVFGGWTDFGTGSGANYVSDIGRVMF
jgi:hypothetical protein